MWKRPAPGRIALAALLAAGLASAAAAQDAGLPVTFSSGAVSAFSFSISADPSQPRVIFESGESDRFSEDWDTVLFQGMSPDAGVVFEVSRREASGNWTPWARALVKRFPSGRFWARARLALGSGPLRLRALDRGAAANAIEIFTVEVFVEGGEDREVMSEQAPLFTVTGGTRPSMQSRARWNAAPPKAAYVRHVPLRVTLHHTSGFQSKTLADSLAEVRFIQDFHQNGRGWSDIAYHFLIDAQGNVFEGRPEWVVGAHVAGRNTGNIGIALLGTHQPPKNDPVTPQGQDALISLGRYLVGGHGIAPDSLKGHRDYRDTDCPGELAYALLGRLRQEFGQPAPAPAPPSPVVEKSEVAEKLSAVIERAEWDGKP